MKAIIPPSRVPATGAFFRRCGTEEAETHHGLAQLHRICQQIGSTKLDLLLGLRRAEPLIFTPYSASIIVGFTGSSAQHDQPPTPPPPVNWLARHRVCGKVAIRWRLLISGWRIEHGPHARQRFLLGSSSRSAHADGGGEGRRCSAAPPAGQPRTGWRICTIPRDVHHRPRLRRWPTSSGLPVWDQYTAW